MFLGNKFWVVKVTVHFHSTSNSFISKAKRKCDCSSYDPFKIITNLWILSTWSLFLSVGQEIYYSTGLTLSPLHYCSSLLADGPVWVIKCLQHMVNAGAQLILNQARYSCVFPLLWTCYWCLDQVQKAQQCNWSGDVAWWIQVYTVFSIKWNTVHSEWTFDAMHSGIALSWMIKQGCHIIRLN